ncbi:hypothetical protein [Flavobacterium sp.]|uniref:hypothetical protein n=1 Tax=Flavobacterium sp. TaxID=239 RepID=UPI0035B1262D
MKHRIFLLFLFTLGLISCRKDEAIQKLEQEKEAKKLEVIFENINRNWNFNTQPINATSQQLTQNWSEWRNFLKELSQKPKSSIGAFQQKAKTLSKKAQELNNNIPVTYNKPEIKSRIASVATKINSINLYIHLKTIPDEKIIQLVPEINEELRSLQNQLAEIDQKNNIKMEDGEADMIKMLDTSRAIKTNNPEKDKIIK